ncbi:MAG: 30S ribosomal protein S7 [bacterium]|nr:30S ribosomal protein S7 [bacterium]
MRGKQAPRRSITPDPKYGSVTLAKFTNYIMKRGKKTVAQGIVYAAFEDVAKRSEQDPLDVFARALKNVAPAMEVRSKRVGGANYQVPFPVRGDRRQSLAFRWLLGATRQRKGKSMAARLADELLAASQGEGAAVKKRQDVQRMADSNRAFAHFAW